jgi:S1-C subfamily serine protease
MNNSESTISAIGLPDGSVFPIEEVLAADATADVAIVRAQLNGRSLATPRLCVDAPVGSAIGLISTPGDAHFFFTTGIISRYGFWPYNGQPAARMDITADFARGSSGFPVYDSEGNAVGIVTSTTSFHSENQNGKKENLQMVFKHCVPMRSILRLIEGSLP